MRALEHVVVKIALTVAEGWPGGEWSLVFAVRVLTDELVSALNCHLYLWKTLFWVHHLLKEEALQLKQN